MAAIPNVANTANMNQNKYGLSALFAPTPPPPITPNFKAMSSTEAIMNIAINGPTLPIFHQQLTNDLNQSFLRYFYSSDV